MKVSKQGMWSGWKCLRKQNLSNKHRIRENGLTTKITIVFGEYLGFVFFFKFERYIYTSLLINLCCIVFLLRCIYSCLYLILYPLLRGRSRSFLPVLVAEVSSVTGNSAQLFSVAAQRLGREFELAERHNKGFILISWQKKKSIFHTIVSVDKGKQFKTTFPGAVKLKRYI